MHERCLCLEYCRICIPRIRASMIAEAGQSPASSFCRLLGLNLCEAEASCPPEEFMTVRTQRVTTRLRICSSQLRSVCCYRVSLTVKYRAHPCAIKTSKLFPNATAVSCATLTAMLPFGQAPFEFRLERNESSSSSRAQHACCHRLCNAKSV